MAEIKEQSLPEAPSIPKRKCDAEALTPEPKKQKPDMPENLNPGEGEDDSVLLERRSGLESVVEGKEVEEERRIDTNGKSAVDKGKGVYVEDKGKGKLQAEESDSSSGSSSEDEFVGEEEEDGDFLDDPLAEVDLSNILPSRTRRRVAEPGAYLVNDLDEDDEDDEDEDVDGNEDPNDNEDDSD